ncbi:MAG TPA: rhodanese-like domain-containing protein [Beijerinckiaceae bacterium]|nr:rhodanese-like domain-containing protein [Beijerinckiaceae bacterium]
MTIIDLSLDDVRQGLADGTLILVDVREDNEFAMGRIPGSLSMPLSRFDVNWLRQFDGRRVVFSCAAGVRSQHALMAAQSAGLGIEEHYRGGFKDWIMAGGPVDSGA